MSKSCGLTEMVAWSGVMVTQIGSRHSWADADLSIQQYALCLRRDVATEVIP